MSSDDLGLSGTDFSSRLSFDARPVHEVFEFDFTEPEVKMCARRERGSDGTDTREPDEERPDRPAL